MFRLEPERTPWDLSFAIAGFPVRIHPFFWLAAVILGINGNRDDVVGILIWVGALLVSITIHEVGHAIAFRRYGLGSRIVLYGMGGLCIPMKESYRMVSRAEFPWNNIFISFAGPLAGFLFAGLIVGLVYTIGIVKGIPSPITFEFNREVLILWRINSLIYANLGGLTGAKIINTLLMLNIFWGLINLLPVYPLDGGQIARSLFKVYSRGEPIRHSLVLSMIAAVATALWAAMSSQFWLSIMFLMLTFNNYQELRITSEGESEEYYG